MANTQQDDDQNAEAPLSLSLFPSPPIFYRDFTTENVKRMRALRRENQLRTHPDTSAKAFKERERKKKARLDPLGVPRELTNLNPPPPPAEGESWRNFFNVLTIGEKLKTLEEGGVQRLGPALDGETHVDRALHLKTLVKSMLLNFVELIGVMGFVPEHGLAKIEDMRTMLFNFHHTLNEYRPHQAREQLIALMQDQLDAKRAETAAMRGVTERATSVLEGLRSLGLEGREDVKEEGGWMVMRGQMEDGEDRKMQEELEGMAWRKVDGIFT